MGARSARPIRIVIAEDHPAVREELRALLDERVEFSVVGEATDGVEALDLARTLRPDVVVMDVSMPRMDGVEATRRIRAEIPSVIVIGLSTHEQPSGPHAIESAGAVAYVTKDADAPRLVERLLSILTTH